MSNIQINSSVIHKIVKEQHQSIQKSIIIDKVLPVDIPAVLKLITGITFLYGKRENAAHYGVFLTDNKRGYFPDAFNNYAGLTQHSDEQFIDLTKIAMKSLYDEAKDQSAASGGYILYADYTNNHGRYFLIAMIKQTDGITLGPNHVPEELTRLDMSRLNQAARINFEKLAAFNKADENERSEIHYLSFVSPSATKTASGYFITALGCAKGTTLARATDAVIKAGRSFFAGHSELKKHDKAFYDDLLSYLEEKNSAEQSAKLSEIEKIARKYIPADDQEAADKLADDFITFLNNEENGIPPEFPPDLRTLHKYTKIKCKTDDWEFRFDKKALGETENAPIYYDRNKRSIVIRNLPEDALAEIEKELDEKKVK